MTTLTRETISEGAAAPSVPAPRSTLARGALVGRFKVLRHLERGGMGDVYAARDINLGRKVALKMVRADLWDPDRDRERLWAEAQITARFSHPNIVTVYEVGEHEGQQYLALEYIDGQTLKERAREHPLAVSEVIRVGLAIARALNEAHRHRVLHRDLKPSNVMIAAEDGRVRVLDFGLARSFVDDVGAEGAPRGGSGTPVYMAPEQWQGEPLTAATDVWALGLVLHELLEGRHPYAELTRTELAEAITGPAVVPPISGAVPGPLRELIDRCLAKDARSRCDVSFVIATLTDLAPFGGETLGEQHSPFRGLLPCSGEDARAFFGRELEIAQLMEHLRKQAQATIVGPSGAGKSSLVRAGVIPRLREQHRCVLLQLRPGRAPLQSLAARLLGRVRSGDTGSGRAVKRAGAERTAEALGATLRANPERLALELEQVAEDEQARVIVFVDQLEELVTQCEDPAEREAFALALVAAGDDPDGEVRVIVAARDDFLGRLAAGNAGRRLLRGILVLRQPSPDALAEILVRSVGAHGYHFEDDGLVGEIVAAVADEQAALPLLQMTGQLLWAGRSREPRVLTRSAYDAMGGVAGALAGHADGVLAGLTSARRDLARLLLLRLIHADGSGPGHAVRRVVRRASLLDGLGPGAAEVLDALVAGRLVAPRRAGDEQDDDDPELELVHESLIASWPRLAGWVSESVAELVFLRGAREAAAAWERRGRRDADLWRGDELRTGLTQAATIVSLPQEVARFIEAGRVATQRRQRRRLIGLAAAFVVLLGVALGFLTLALEASAQRDESRRLEQLADEHRVAAEDLIDFMLGDLRDKLTPIGRLDLLRLPAERAREYYRQRPVDYGIVDQARRSALAHANLGDVLLGQGEQDAALAEYRAADEIAVGLIERRPDDAEAAKLHALTLAGLGRILLGAGDVREALESLRASEKLRARLVREQPADRELTWELAEVRKEIGWVALAYEGRFKDATAHFRASQRLVEGLVASEPDNPKWPRGLVDLHVRLGHVARDRGDHEAALSEYREGAGVLNTLIERNPDDAHLRRDRAIFSTRIGMSLVALGQLDAAMEVFRSGRGELERLVAADSSNKLWKTDLAILEATIGGVLSAEGDEAEAESHYARCLAHFEPIANEANDFYNAACCAARAGQPDRAFAMLERYAEYGVRNTAWLKKDPDLAPLRTDPRWDALIVRLEGGSPASSSEQ